MKNRSKMIKAVAALCSTLILASSFAGCGGSTASNSSSTASTAVATTPADSTVAANPYEKPIKLTMSTVDADKAGKNEDGSDAANLVWLKEKFNVDIQFESLTWGDYVDKTRLWIASGDGPDLMMLDIAPTRYPEYLNWVKGGLIKAYPDLAAYPNLQEKMDKMITGKKFIVDGKLYAWPAYLDMQEYDYAVNVAFTYRKDWAQAVGLYQEDEIYTLDEWSNLVKEVIAKDPNKNGAGKTIGMIGSDWTFPKYFGSGAISPNLLYYAKDSSGKWVWGPMLPESLETVKTTKKMYDDGIIWKDQIMAKQEDATNKFNAGLSFASIGPNVAAGGLLSTVNEFKKTNPTVDPQKAIGVGHIAGPDGKVLNYQATDQWSQTALNPTLSDEKIERWCHVLDYLASDEGYYFRTLGIKGTDWEMEGDKPVAKWVNDPKTGLPKNPYGFGTWPWARAASCMDNFSNISPEVPQWVKDTAISGLKLSMSSEAHIIPLNPDLAYFSAPNYDKVGTKEGEIYQEVAKLMVTKGDIEKEWNAWVESKMSIIQPVLDELNATLK